MGAGLPGSFAPRPPDTREQDRARREQQQRWDEIGRIREYILRTYGLPQFPGFPVDAERRLQDQWLSVAVSDYQKARAAAKGKDDIRFHPPRITGVDPVSFTANIASAGTSGSGERVGSIYNPMPQIDYYDSPGVEFSGSGMGADANYGAGSASNSGMGGYVPSQIPTPPPLPGHTGPVPEPRYAGRNSANALMTFPKPMTPQEWYDDQRDRQARDQAAIRDQRARDIMNSGLGSPNYSPELIDEMGSILDGSWTPPADYVPPSKRGRMRAKLPRTTMTMDYQATLAPMSYQPGLGMTPLYNETLGL